MVRFLLARLGAIALVLLFAVSGAQAGQMQDFERELRIAYSDYRTALFRTNMNDKAASEAAIEAMAAKWQTLMAKWLPAPPPQYAEDRLFKSALDNVAKVLAIARTEAASTQLAAAHDTLEKIRDELGNLRRRNGVRIFSDRMNAFHEQMEKILRGSYDNFDLRGVANLRDDVAVLTFLAEDIAANPPADRDATYESTFVSVRKSVEDLREAIRSGDVPAIKAAIKTLKQPYARMFLNYG